MLEGQVTVTFADGTAESPRAGDLFYWPPGHTVRADENSEIILFSPQAEHTPVIEHLRAKMLG